MNESKRLDKVIESTGLVNKKIEEDNMINYATSCDILSKKLSDLTGKIKASIPNKMDNEMVRNVKEAERVVQDLKETINMLKITMYSRAI